MSTAGPTGWRRWGPWVGAAGMLVALWLYGFVNLLFDSVRGFMRLASGRGMGKTRPL